MWTSEFEFDNTIITVMDDKGAEEDVTIELGDDYVDIRQYNNTFKAYDLITLTPKMMLEMLEAFKHPEGLWKSEVGKTKLD